MHDARPLHPDPIRSRGQLELELARLAMRIKHACGQLTSGRLRDSGRAGSVAVADWFGELAEDLIARTESRLVAYAKERIKALAVRLRLVPPMRGDASPQRRVHRPAPTDARARTGSAPLP